MYFFFHVYFLYSTTVSNIEQLLNCQYYDYESIHQDGIIVHRLKKGTNYHVSDTISSYISLVTPTTAFPPVHVSIESYSTSSVADTNRNTPDYLHKLYQVPSGTSGSNQTNTEGVASFIGQYYNSDDLSAFWTMYTQLSKAS